MKGVTEDSASTNNEKPNPDAAAPKKLSKKQKRRKAQRRQLLTALALVAMVAVVVAAVVGYNQWKDGHVETLPSEQRITAVVNGQETEIAPYSACEIDDADCQQQEGQPFELDLQGAKEFTLKLPKDVYDHDWAMLQIFDDPGAMNAACSREDLEITPDHVLILRNAGPVGGPGMPEWGNLPIPKALLKRGINDIVRICDGRMSGTHFGTCVLHVSPESAVGGPLALVHDGDMIVLDAVAGTLQLDVPEAELTQRRQEWRPPQPRYSRSFTALYQRHVSQAHDGCDFDFLEGTEAVPEPPIY